MGMIRGYEKVALMDSATVCRRQSLCLDPPLLPLVGDTVSGMLVLQYFYV